jgi:hypothetical protein
MRAGNGLFRVGKTGNSFGEERVVVEGEELDIAMD